MSSADSPESPESGGHHLILGELTDHLTGKTLADTLDERYRQKIARLLTEEKGYDREMIRPRIELMVRAGENRARLKIDFGVRMDRRTGMILLFGPGSLVTRRRSVLAASRLIEPYQIPVAVITNGEDAEILDGETGKRIGSGLNAIPAASELNRQMESTAFSPISSQRAAIESRILYAYEVDGACPCDDTICRL